MSRKPLHEQLQAMGLVSLQPLAAIEAEDGQLPEWIHLAPFGTFVTHYAGAFELTAEVFGRILENFERVRTDVLVDWEHESLWGSTKAAGWIDRLELRDNGLWGHVSHWTPTAAQQLKDREFRYLSPTFWWNFRDSNSGEELGAHLHSVALTNTPYLTELDPMLPNSAGPQGDTMLLALLSALSLPEDATEEQALGAVDELKTRSSAALDALGVAADAELEDITAAGELRKTRDALVDQVGAALSWQGLPEDADEQLRRELEHSGYVPYAEHTAALTAAEQAQQANDTESLLAEARAKGVLTPALESWAKKTAASDPVGFRAWMATAPKVPLKSPLAERRPSGGDGSLTDDELAICKQLGVSHENYAKAAKAQKEG